MKISTVSVTISRTVRPRQYEAVAVTLTQTAEVEEGEKVSSVRKELYEKTSDALDIMLDMELDRHLGAGDKDA
jgi:hypothetical protein